MGKKITSLLLALVMVLSMLPLSLVTAVAAEEDEGLNENAAWKIASGTNAAAIKAWVTPYGTLMIKCVSDGAEMKDFTASGATAAPWMAYKDKITALSFSGNKEIKRIGDYAFNGLDKLTGKLTIPDSVETIGEKAFYQCEKLTSLVIPASVTNIGKCAFAFCSGLTSVDLKGQYSNSYFENDAFQGVGKQDTLCYLTFPADSGWWSTDDYLLKDSVDNSGYFQWKGGYFIPLGQWNAGKDGNQIIAKLTPNKGEEETYTLSLKGAGSLEYMPWSYYKDKITEVDFDNKITAITGQAFSGYTKLKSIDLPDSLTTIGAGAFSGCTGLTKVTIPASVRNINPAAFRDCTGLTNLAFEGKKPTVSNAAFYGVGSITPCYLTFPADDGWGYSLTDGTKQDGYYTWKDGNFIPLGDWNVVPDSDRSNSEVIAKLTPNKDEEETYSLSLVGSGTVNYIPWSYLRSKITSVNFDNRIEVITSDTFKNLTILTSVKLPNNLKEIIGGEGFASCTSLSSLTIPASVNKIGTKTFSNCVSLQSVEFKGGMPSFSSNDAFSGVGSETPCALTFPADGTWNGLNAGMNSWQSGSFMVLGSWKVGDNITASAKYDAKTDTYTLSLTGSGAMNGARPWSTIAASVTSLSLSKDITTICDDAFKDFTALGFVTLPAKLTTIGENAFNGCTKLTNLTVPAKVTSIGANAFSNCVDIDSVEFKGNMPTFNGEAFTNVGAETPCSLTFFADTSWNGLVVGEQSWQGGKFMVLDSWKVGDKVTASAKYDAKTDTYALSLTGSGPMYDADAYPWSSIDSSVTKVTFSNGITTIGKNAFSSCTDLTEVTIPATVVTVGDSAFENCTGLGKLTISKGVETIGKEAFAGCTGLKKLTMADGLVTIGERAFAGCTGLTDVIIPKTVNTIGASAFVDCADLSKLAITNGVKVIGTSAFVGCSKLTSVTIPGTVTKIEESAFKGCADLEKLTLYEGVKTIGKEAFAGTGVTSVKIPKTVTAVSESSFKDCTKLTSVAIAEGATAIGKEAFAGCTKLASVSISKTVADIGERAFVGCTGMKKLTLAKGVETIGDFAFASCTDLTALAIPETVKTIGVSAFADCTFLDTLTLTKGVETIGANAFAGTGVTAVAIPETVKTIGDGAFKNCIDLTTVTLAKGVKTIGTSAFANTGLTTLAIPETVTTIGASAFADCAALDGVALPQGMTEIPGSMFAKCITLTTVNIPKTVTTIGASAFADCADLEKLLVPAGITSIGENAFANTGLKKLFFEGVKPAFADNTFANVSGNVVFFSESWGSASDTDLGSTATFTSVHYMLLNHEFTVNDVTYRVTDIDELNEWDDASHEDEVKITKMLPHSGDFYTFADKVGQFTVAGVEGDAFEGVGTKDSPMPIRLPASWLEAGNYPKAEDDYLWHGGYLAQTYFVTFDRNDADADSATRETIEKASVPYLDTITKPVMTDTKSVSVASRTDVYEFAGWYYKDENGQEMPWNFGTPMTFDVALKAHWLKQTVKQAHVTGTVEISGGTRVPGAIVELWKGNTLIAADTTNELGGFDFDAVELGTYNIVVDAGTRSSNYMKQVISTKDGICSFVLTLPSSNILTTMELKDDAGVSGQANVNGAVVDGLDKVANAQAKPVLKTTKSGSATTPQVTFSMESVEEDKHSDEHKQILKLAAKKGHLEFFDISLMNGDVDLGKTNKVLLAVHIPFNTASATNIVVYRSHDANNNGKVDTDETYAMLLDPKSGQEGFVINNGEIVIYAYQFSAYAIGYDDGKGGTSSGNSGNSGGSGSSGTYYTSTGKSFTTSFNGINAVYVDGQKVSSKYYTVSGRTVTLSQEYLATLTTGTHTFNAQSSTMQGKATFTVKNGRAVSAARTGDIGVFPYVAIGIAVLALGVVTVMRRREERY